MHEASLWRHNRFLTLTYDDDHLPRELKPDDLQKFFKRLRKHARTEGNVTSDRHASIRYLACGEYGEHTMRPHYHASLFNCGFADERRYSSTLSSSAALDRIWGKGTARLAPFTAATAGYVAGYITKAGGQRTYADDDGELRHPPFRRASTRPAIGRQWLEKYATDLQHGYMIADHQKTRIPRYYIKRLLITHQQHTEDIRAQPSKATDNRSEARLRDKEIIHHQHINKKNNGHSL